MTLNAMLMEVLQIFKKWVLKLSNHDVSHYIIFMNIENKIKIWKNISFE